ncbi:MAG: thiamine phosphate synthase [Actinobacteria bacterium]|nr:thiamine phosphate synthase [Actinomycetota bacterium]MCA1719861.1 thiamine phosphate synthase [Actinomycetota bacterium]
MTLPRLLLLTDRRASCRPLLDVVAAAVEGGARAVVLREKDLPIAERAALAERLAAVLAPVGGRLVLAGGGIPAQAVHLAADEAVPEPRPAQVGRSCHDADELGRARTEGCDWVTLSPVFATDSKPGYGPALGLDGLRDLLASAPPAYALGGVDAGNAHACLDAGAHGVAVMGAVMRADDPAGCVAELLAAL